jgi:ADP-ribose pyrophosphatase YjhB (NUDIX family)
MREETGLEVRPLELLYATEGYYRSKDYPENQLMKVYWRVERTGGQLVLGGNGDDIASCFWAPISELAKTALTESDAAAVRRMQERGIL